MRSQNLSRLYDVLEYLVDERVGVIRDVTETKRDPGAPNLFSFYARACNTLALGQRQNFAEGVGASPDRGRALAKSIGEAVERYCSAFYEPDELPLYSYDAAPFRCIRPSHFALYSESQHAETDFPYRCFTHETPIRWTPAIDLVTQESHHVPAAMVFIPYFYDQKHGETAVVQPISTGLACHCSTAEAAISAICEVIERDAFTLTWQAKLAMPQILVETLSDQNRDLVARYEKTGASVVLLNITMDHSVPTILSVLRHSAHEAPALIFAAAAHPDPEDAVRKSLEELELTRRVAQDLKTKRPLFDPGHNFENVTNQECHISLFCDQSNLFLADFIFASDEQISFTDIRNLSVNDPETDLKTIVERIRSIKHQVLLVDLTTPDIRDLGLYVNRAVIPGFHPLFFGHRFRALGGTRLWTVPQKLGHVGITPGCGDNPIPHPYP